MPERLWQQRFARFVEDRRFSRTIIGLILVNAAVLGMETSPTLVAQYGPLLRTIDQAILAIFVVELALRIAAFRGRFFQDPWSLFDTAIVAIALVPANEAFSVLRALRVLRVLRLISAFPQLRKVLEGLVAAIPGLGSIGAVLAIFQYVFAVMAAKLFGQQYPELFGDLFVSLFTLFQIMTLDGWSEIVRRIDTTHPYAGVFFVSYILLSTFTVLNLLIAVMVNTIGGRAPDSDSDVTLEIRPYRRTVQTASIRSELKELNRKLDLILAQNKQQQVSITIPRDRK
jgi:voltage-gated sodium channel